jgi:hypothetical protein
VDTLFYAPRQAPDGNVVAEPLSICKLHSVCTTVDDSVGHLPPTFPIGLLLVRNSLPRVENIYESVCLQLFNYLLDALIQPQLMFYLG